MKRTDLALFKRLFKDYIKPRLGLIALAIFFMLVFAGASAMQPLILKGVFDKIFSEKNDWYRQFLPLGIVSIFLVLGVSNYLANITMSYAGFSIVNTMQKDMFKHIITSDLDLHYKKNSGDLASRLTNDTTYIRAAVTDVVVVVFKQTFTMAGLVIVMFYQSWKLSLIAFAVLFLVVYPIMKAARRLRKLARQSQEQSGVLLSKLGENFKAIRTIKAYQNEEFEIARTNEIMDRWFLLKVKSLRVSQRNGPTMSVLAGCAIAAVLWYAGHQVVRGEITQGQLVAFVASLLMAARPLKTMGSLSNILQNALMAAERFYAMIDWKPGIIDKPGAAQLKLSGGEIKLENLTFKYASETGENNYALKDVNINIPAGKMVALVGHSGSGKSTILNMLLRFFEQQSGRILIDGQDIRDFTIQSLRSNISLVTQDIFLFDDTIRANIAYGISANVSEEAIVEAAKAAAAHEFILALPNGYDTMVGESGVRLSGGQKQRVSIARAILRQSPILLLDEATSALDNKSEREFQTALEKIVEGRTTIVIAHRLSTVKNSDLIYVMDQSEVVASGTHEELLEKSEIYRELYN